MMSNETETAKKILTDANLEGSFWGKKIIAAEKRGAFTDANVDEPGYIGSPQIAKLEREMFSCIKWGAYYKFDTKPNRIKRIRAAAKLFVEISKLDHLRRDGK